MKIWIPIVILVIIVLLFAGLLPMPGQKDDRTPSTQPGVAPQAELPKGPPPSPPADSAADAKQPPPGGTPQPSPGSTAPR